MKKKTLHNTDISGTRKNVADLVTFGDADSARLLFKASSANEGWMKSTKALEVPNVGCVVFTSTQQRNPDGSYVVAEAMCFVPGVFIVADRDEDGKIIGRHLINIRAGF